ncbi:MAG: DUF4012 domain-containing protein [Mycobacteriales bacterium]
MVAAGGVLGAVAVVWVVVTALMARSQLQNVQGEIGQLRSAIADGRMGDARSLAAQVRGHAHRADQLTSGPAWWAGASVPGAGDPLESIRALTSAGDRLGRHAVPALMTVATNLDPATLRRSGNEINIAAIAASRPALKLATEQLAAAAAQVHASPASTWISTVDRGRSQLLTKLTNLSGTLNSADRAATLMPAMLGVNKPMRYFVGVQNEAEARGTGGIPGTYAIVVAYHGKVRITQIGSDTEMEKLDVTTDLGPDFQSLYGSALPMRHFANSNVSPHFPYAARIWAAMWRQKSGQRIDGAIALDPTALGYFLKMTGPAHLADGTVVSASNLSSLTQQQAYVRYHDTTRRKAYLVGLAKAVETKILGGEGNPLALMQAASLAANQRRILVWAADPRLEAELQKTPMSGIIPQTKTAYAGLAVINAAGSKLDYYLNRRVTWQRSCNPHDVTARITLRNGAPASGLPAYVTFRSDSRAKSAKPGDNRLHVQWYASAGSKLLGLTVEGKPGLVSTHQERGHPVYLVDLELPQGVTRTIVLHLHDPTTGTPQILRQPLVHPLAMTTSQARCTP